jgi:hypothetical protein
MTVVLSAGAKVTVTVEVTVGSSWGEKCDLAQVYCQAEREALDTLTSLLSRSERCSIKVVGKPRIDAIIASKEER